jgi:3-phosphoglycerate kinase
MCREASGAPRAHTNKHVKSVMSLLHKLSVKDLAASAIANKRFLIRVDFNVPLDKKTGAISNNQRIVEALPTVQYVLDHGARSVVLMSHLGRPNGTATPSASLKPVAVEVEKLLKRYLCVRLQAFVHKLASVDRLHFSVTALDQRSRKRVQSPLKVR